MYLDRIYKIALFFALCFTLIAGRIYDLQGVQSEKLKVMAEKQRQKTVEVNQYRRGDFLDCLGRSLTNKTTPCLVVFPNGLGDSEKTAQVLAGILSLDEKTVYAKLKSAVAQGKSPFILKPHLDDAQTEAVQKENLAGIFVLPLNARYDRANSAVHLLGFVGAISPPEEKAYREKGETPPSSGFVGKSGLEKLYDVYLQGKPAQKLAMTTDEKGNPVPGLGWQYLSNEAQDQSSNVQLTINADDQLLAARALGNMPGAVVVMDVKNGDVLALASSPRYDPYMNEAAPTEDAYINKALACYPPASVFKIVLTVAALEEKVALPQDFVCKGYYALASGRHVACWKEGGHGPQNLPSALANSCNPYFVNLGLLLGGDTIKKYAQLLGLEQQSLIGYPFSDNTKHIQFNSAVTGDVANASIGENGVSLSPLQIAGLISLVANGGNLVQPRIVSEIIPANGQTGASFPAVAPQRVISEETAKTVRDYLIGAVKSGTGSSAGGALYVGGKTGTSEDKGVWFAGFFPADDPRWAIVVYREQRNGRRPGRRQGVQRNQ